MSENTYAATFMLDPEKHFSVSAGIRLEKRDSQGHLLEEIDKTLTRYKATVRDVVIELDRNEGTARLIAADISHAQHRLEEALRHLTAYLSLEFEVPVDFQIKDIANLDFEEPWTRRVVAHGTARLWDGNPAYEAFEQFSKFNDWFENEKAVLALEYFRSGVFLKALELAPLDPIYLQFYKAIETIVGDCRASSPDKAKKKLRKELASSCKINSSLGDLASQVHDIYHKRDSWDVAHARRQFQIAEEDVAQAQRIAKIVVKGYLEKSCVSQRP